MPTSSKELHRLSNRLFDALRDRDLNALRQAVERAVDELHAVALRLGDEELNAEEDSDE